MLERRNGCPACGGRKYYLEGVVEFAGYLEPDEDCGGWRVVAETYGDAQVGGAACAMCSQPVADLGAIQKLAKRAYFEVG